jgi:hypothetical protein
MLLIRDRVIEWLVNYISGQNYAAAFVNKTPTFLIDFGSSGIIPSKYRVDFSQNKIPNNRVGANLLREYCRIFHATYFDPMALKGEGRN